MPYENSIKGSVFNRSNDTEKQVEKARIIANSMRDHEKCALMSICRIAAHIEGGNLKGKIAVDVTPDMARVVYAIEESGFKMDDMDSRIMSDIIRCLGLTKNIEITKSGEKFQKDRLEEDRINIQRN